MILALRVTKDRVRSNAQACRLWRYARALGIRSNATHQLIKLDMLTFNPVLFLVA